MSLRVIEILEENADPKVIENIARDHGAIDIWRTARDVDNAHSVHILYEAGHDQGMMDALQNALSTDDKWRLVVYPVETSLPIPDETKEKISSLRKSLSREELFDDVQEGARLDSQYVLLVVLSIIVAAIGLVQDNVAVIIGAMVIAPLLGPNLALSYAAAMGERALMIKASLTLAFGTGLSLALCYLYGLFLSVDITQSHELMARTDIGYDVPLLALASGAAAVISMTGGASSALVGVMVAVALLPPAAATGLLAGVGEWGAAFRALTMLVANIVCVNLAAQCVLLFKGIKPRTWLAKRSAKQSVKVTFMFWGVLLVLVFVLIALLAPVLE